jgi:hypothetical protein
MALYVRSSPSGQSRMASASEVMQSARICRRIETSWLVIAVPSLAQPLGCVKTSGGLFLKPGDTILPVERPRDVQIKNGRIEGREIAKLMRMYRVTIRDLSQRTGITMKRIRQVRENGLDNRRAIRDWIEAITGEAPGRI